MGAQGPAAGANTLMDSVDLEQRGPTGSEVSVLTLVEERGVLFCRLVLDVTSVAASCVSPLLVLLAYFTSLSAQSLRFNGSVVLNSVNKV